MSAQRILVGIDGSDQSKQALAWALDHASPGDTVTLVTAATEGLGAEGASAVIDGVMPAAPPAGVTLDRAMPATDPVEALLLLAEDSDLLVVGRHGTSGLIHSAMGSVGDACSRLAPVPVVIVPPRRTA